MSALAVNPVYMALLAKIPPRVIRSDEQNEAYIEALYEMEQRKGKRNREERELADLLTLLIEDYEEKYYRLPRSSPLEGDCFPDGAAWLEAEGPVGCVWDAEHCVRGFAREAGVE